MVRKQKLLVMVLIALMVLVTGCAKNAVLVDDTQEMLESVENESTESEETIEQGVAEEEKRLEEVALEESQTISEIPFPYMLEDGKLEIGSLFPFGGFNPDAGNEMVSDIAAISVKNISNQYLEEATITVGVDEETEITFKVTDLPAGAGAMAFSLENISLDKNAVCSSVRSETAFSNEILGIPEQISVEEEDIQVRVTNVSGQDISKVTIYCRCLFDEEYFGGIAYQYELQGLAAGETRVVDTEEFLLGMVEVVRVEIE